MLSRRLLALIILAFASIAWADETPKKDSLDRDYYLYAPQRIDPKKTYWLVVGVHGYGGDGKGAAGLAAWVRKGDCIVVGPSFPNNGYQLLQQQSDEQLTKLFEELQKKYTLHPKLFIYGFSGGAQFAHRFMMKYPDLVAGCSAHSAGSWATGDQWMSVNPAAAGIPFVMSCGMSDTAKSTPDSPMTRYEWAQAFEKQIKEAGFCYDAQYWPKTAHSITPGVATMTEDCYRIATQLVPQHEQAVADIRKLIDAGKTAAARAAIAKARHVAPKSASPLLKTVVEKETKELDGLAEEIKPGAGNPAKPAK